MNCVFPSLFLVIFISITSAQLPPRLQVPGALLSSQSRPAPFRQQSRLLPENVPPPRLRRPIPNSIPLREVRPVVEETEEPQFINPQSSFDDEVNKLGIAALSSAVRADAASSEEEEPENRPLVFRPERPVPVSREQIREKPQPVFRPEISRPPPRPVVRQEIRDEPLPVRQPVRQQTRTSLPPPVPVRQVPARPRQPLDEEEEERLRRRKPQVQILRKYRTDNDDGSITWGFENDDGTFKEETLGVDCIIRGRYGYVDPDGVKRDFSYEAGNKCDEPEPEEEDLPPSRPNIPQQLDRRPLPTQYRA